jgi:hypothetical protein
LQLQEEKLLQLPVQSRVSVAAQGAGRLRDCLKVLQLQLPQADQEQR